MDNNPENSSRRIYGLSEITASIERMFAKHYDMPYWIKAEMSKLNYYPPSGHCYPDLVEKKDGVIAAQIRSVIWKDNLTTLSKRFEEVTREPLRDGISILCLAYVRYSSLYGLSLQIIDIDPLFTLGEMARDKMEAIERLKREGIFELNRKLPLPLLVKRIAVISGETSKGYSDLITTLNNNGRGYRFIIKLYTAILQGDGAVDSIRAQLIKIKARVQHFDAVAIIRGGGAETGMACYDHYALAAEVAQFPLPVITGIGHSTNETVVEMVAHTHKITPTDVAHFLLSFFLAYDERITTAAVNLKKLTVQLVEGQTDTLNLLARSVIQSGRQYVNRERQQLHHLALNARHLIGAGVFNHRVILSNYEQTLYHVSDQFVNIQQRHLSEQIKFLKVYYKHFHSTYTAGLTGLHQRIILLDPVNILKRGFSITRFQGKAISSTHKPEPGTTIETETFEQKLISTINTITEK
ncbi:MAG: exodeoxyribonuclease VII large subunit [Lentimicrobiaceae bacterium]|nr:exodeoxyribonuclease VII large subunit [Lentimicrobiaceae bacterium]